MIDGFFRFRFSRFLVERTEHEFAGLFVSDAEELLTANEDDFLIVARFIRRRHGFRVKEREERDV